MRQGYKDRNLKVNEFICRRADIEGVVTAHLAAMERASSMEFGRFIISATTPLEREDSAELRRDAPAAARRHVPRCQAENERRGWSMLQSIDRVYVNELARSQLAWRPKYDFAFAIERLRADEDFRSPLAIAVGRRDVMGRSLVLDPAKIIRLHTSRAE